MSSLPHRDPHTNLGRQLPLFVWLVVLWMLLWGQFTVLALVTGIIIAVLVTRVFRLPPVELSGRINAWYLIVAVVALFGDLVRGSLTVARQALDPRRPPRAAIIRVQLLVDDDLILTNTAIAASLIPGSLVVEADRDRRILYLHVIGVRTHADVDQQRESVLLWERRIVRAVGSREQVEQVNATPAEAVTREAKQQGEAIRKESDSSGGEQS